MEGDDGTETDLLSVMQTGEGRIRMVLNTAAFPDPGAWGIILADTVQHLTNALGGNLACEGQVMTPQKVRSRILEMFHDELKSPSSPTRKLEVGQA